jgi:hypothetical protein
MPEFSQDPIAIGQDGFTAAVAASCSLGQIGKTKDGRVFKYCKAGVADLVPGNVVQSPATVALHLNLVPIAAAVGALQVSATLGAQAAAAGQYAEGYLYTDGGINYGVAGHAAVLSAGVITVNLKPADGLQAAITGASRVGLIANPYNGVVQCPVALTGIPVGVATYIIPAGQFGWIQIGGPCAVLVNGAPGLGVSVANGATAAGSVDVITTTNLVTSTLIGTMLQLGVTGKPGMVQLKMS